MYNKKHAIWNQFCGKKFKKVLTLKQYCKITVTTTVKYSS